MLPEGGRSTCASRKSPPSVRTLAWLDFEGNRESIPAIRDNEGKLVTDPIEKANALNNYYAFVFSRESINLRIQVTETGKSFTTSTNVTRKRISVIGKINP